jgi:hypothetical protein
LEGIFDGNNYFAVQLMQAPLKFIFKVKNCVEYVTLVPDSVLLVLAVSSVILVRLLPGFDELSFDEMLLYQNFALSGHPDCDKLMMVKQRWKVRCQ